MEALNVERLGKARWPLDCLVVVNSQEAALSGAASRMWLAGRAGKWDVVRIRPIQGIECGSLFPCASNWMRGSGRTRTWTTGSTVGHLKKAAPIAACCQFWRSLDLCRLHLTIASTFHCSTLLSEVAGFPSHAAKSGCGNSINPVFALELPPLVLSALGTGKWNVYTKC